MYMSNTETPYYYGRFRDSVLHGEIPVCETIELEMNRIDSLIRNRGVYYDPRPVEGWIRFCENELTLVDGSPLKLTECFKLWAEQVYGWYIFYTRSVYQPPKKRGDRGRYVKKRIKVRLINKQFLILGRGGAKTVYDECHQAYGLVMDPTSTDGVTTAPTMIQAEETIMPFKTAITMARGPLFKFLTEGSINNTTGSRVNRPKLQSTKKGIEYFLTNSIVRIRPMRIDKLQGLRCKYATLDEWLSCDIREDPIGALEQGASKNDGYLIVATSSEGTVRNGAGDAIKMELMDILKGEYVNPHVSIWWYKLDDIKEVNFPELWVKANPNIGITVKFETYQREVEKAEKVPSSANDILAKRFGIPTEGFTYYFTYEETLKSDVKRDYWGMQCALGADMSQGDDFCAFTLWFPLPKEKFGVKTRSYITEKTLSKLNTAMRIKYQEFMDEGTLIVMPGVVLDMDDVYEDLVQWIIEREYDVRTIGYDPYNAKTFIDRWAKEFGEFGIVKVPQGMKTESVPLGEIKNLTEESLIIFDEEIMQFTMGNCIVLTDNNGNRKLYKKRNEQKIDNVAAMLDAYIAYKANRDLLE